MFNFLVTGVSGAWENRYYEWDKGRILEYTDKIISDALEKLTSVELTSMMSYPCLFAYEGAGAMLLGRIIGFKIRSATILIEFEIDRNLPEISFDAISQHFSILDVRKWEISRTHWAVKDADLIEVLTESRILPRDIESPIFRRAPTTLPLKEENSVVIRTLYDYISVVLAEPRQDGEETFYRGHSSKESYKLEPSLFRKDKKGNPLYITNEHLLYRELLVSNSADFSNDTSTLDKLVRMQHYSLPTRLLDITSNPLIALYFACKSGSTEDGEVIRFLMKRDSVKYFDSDTASCIANLARMPSNVEIDYTLFEEPALGAEPDLAAFNLQPAIKRLVHFIAEEKPFFTARIDPRDLKKVICVKGKKSNNRISSQSGAFFLFGDNAKLNEGGDDQYSIRRFTVTNKSQLLRELDIMNINESTVFPDVENTAKYFAKKYGFKSP